MTDTGPGKASLGRRPSQGTRRSSMETGMTSASGTTWTAPHTANASTQFVSMPSMFRPDESQSGVTGFTGYTGASAPAVTSTATGTSGASEMAGVTRASAPTKQSPELPVGRSYDAHQRQILDRGRQAGQGRRVAANPLAGASRSDCLDSEGRVKPLRATATVKRVKHSNEADKNTVLPLWLVVLICLAILLVSIALLIAGFATPVFKKTNETDAHRCYNFWGTYKCGTTKFGVKGNEAWECVARANTMRTSLVFGMLALAFCVVMVVCVVLKFFVKTRALNVIVFALAFLNCLFLMFPFALIAVVYHVPLCAGRAMSSVTKYGPALPLFIVPWVLTFPFLGVILFVLR